MHVAGMPGPGGSLGQCQLCGDSFVGEVLEGQEVLIGHVAGMNCDVAVHQKCGKLIKGPWEDMPDGPIRKAFAEAAELTTAAAAAEED